MRTVTKVTGGGGGGHWSLPGTMVQYRHSLGTPPKPNP